MTELFSPRKKGLGIDVLQAARERIEWAFDTFPKVYLSGPSGKDSGVMMHLACRIARERGRRLGVLYIDLEAQYRVTIAHVEEMFALYSDVIDPYWVALPLRLRNAVSMTQPYWICWDPEQKDSWVRAPSARSITAFDRFPFYQPPEAGTDCRRRAMEFEEFVEHFGHWYGEGQATACLVGIRSDESLNRWRAISRNRSSRLQNKPYTTWKGGSLYNAYPIYDWRVDDVWTYFAREDACHNPLYDRMFEAGLTPHQMRICQPYGDDQRRGLGMWAVVEPDTWSRVVSRVNGANYGALYAGQRGNILGNNKVSLPPGHTWESYAKFLLATLPDVEAEHYRNKIAVFIHWWREHKGIEMIDEGDPQLESSRKIPSWRRVCKVILKNDRMCKGLSFTQQRSEATSFERYRRIMRKRRQQWRILEDS